MCTAVSYRTKDCYFGRNLDLDFSYGEGVVVCPRAFELKFRSLGPLPRHYAMIGMAIVQEDFPLFYDAANEKGLGMAGLNFPGSARFHPSCAGRDNVATFEFIPWILAQCATVEEARALCDRLNLTDQAFSDRFPVTPLHWIIADGESSIVVESVADGLNVYDNPTGVLTNNPPFDVQLFHLNNYRHLSARDIPNYFSDKLRLTEYSRGMGGLGMPGDLSSMSRFVRATFTKFNSVCGDSESESLSQFFHILGSVAQQRGCCLVSESGRYEYTVYSSCINLSRGLYYYVTYENSRITAVNMQREDLESDRLVFYPLITGQQIEYQNG